MQQDSPILPLDPVASYPLSLQFPVDCPRELGGYYSRDWMNVFIMCRKLWAFSSQKFLRKSFSIKK